MPVKEMQQLYITRERLKSLRADPKTLKQLEKACNCKIAVAADGTIEIGSKDAFSEFNAKNVVYAFGRGFDMEIALKLVNPEFYFRIIDLGQIESKPERIKQLKARIIGIGGKAKRYIEEVSMAHLSVYGDTVSIIGDITQVSEAETAINTLIDGGTHRTAYIRMEAMHRKNKEAAVSARF
jgi:ribosomal RNA assembly protein